MLRSLPEVMALSGKADRGATGPLQLASFLMRWALCAVLLASCALSTVVRAEENGAAILSPAAVPARGDHFSLLTLKAFGRYSITVTSSQGVALQSLDRMSGAGNIAGEAGKQDGRLDLFLDRGEYRILTHASEHGSGQAKLGAHAFRELNSHPPLLIEQRLEQSSLGDFEQRSYWLEVKEKRTIVIEAAGRHLADLRLWRDGTWLVSTEPQLAASQARADRPLMIARFTAQLEPGLYLVTAYGGPSQPWTEASGEKPFFLRLGIPELGPAVRQQFTMDEFGVVRFVVPEGPNFFRLELPVASAATLQVSSYDKDNPFQAPGSSASIDKRSVPPVAEVTGMGSSGAKLVTVTMEAGKPFVLQYFDASPVHTFKGGGEYWVSSIHAGYAEDSIGATAVLTRRRYTSPYGALGPEEYVDARVLELAGKAPWHRRFNLLDEVTLFVRVPDALKIRVIGQGVKARYRFEPFVTSRPENYQTPPWQESGREFELDPGLWVLTVQPETKGILDLQLIPPGGVVQDALSFLSKMAQETPQPRPVSGVPGETLTPVMPVARFGEMHLDSSTSYTMYLNRQPGVASGLMARPLPVDLQFALPVTQRAGETLAIPVRVPEKGTLRALAEDGRSLEIALDNGSRKGTALQVDPGQYRVMIKGSDAMQVYSLGLEPTRLASQTPLPTLPDATLAALPKFPVITSGTPYYLDLARDSSSDFRVQVAKPGLYRFETTGLLGTAGSVRTRTNPSLFSETENGVGRNFLIQSYLREGEYQLTVNTQGRTQGDLGVQVTRSGVVDGGELRAGEVARALLPSAQALAYRFRIAKAGSYHLQAIGLGRDFKLRLEDADGWPPFAPVLNGANTLQFKPGDYRAIVLPQTSDARVLTRLERVTDKPVYDGHGPHRIEVGARVEHVWREPAKNGARVPDQWEFNLPAAAELGIALDSEMEATVIEVADPKTAVAKIEAKRLWTGKLPAGRYRVLAQNSRSNNHVPYALQISSTQLLAGQSREVAAPAVVPISVGRDGLVELQSFGGSDVRARLVTASGELVAQNDDSPDDWNFHIARRLDPGEYKLMVDPVNEQQASTRVYMRAPDETAEKPLALGTEIEIRDDKVHVYPLPLPEDHNFVLASAQSSDTVGLALEGESARGWVNLGTTLAKDPYLGLPLGAERFRSYRLRAWSADRRSLKVRVRAVAAALSAASESEWTKGSLSLRQVDEARPDLRVAHVAPARPGTFRLKGDLAGLRWSDTTLCAEQVSGNAVIAVSGKDLWMVSRRQRSQEPASLAAERLRLPEGDGASLRLELPTGRVGAIDLQPNDKGPSLAIAQARAGQPGVAVTAKQDPAEMGITPGEAVAVSVNGAAESARVWNASSAGEPLELDVRQVSLRRAGQQSPGYGAADGAMAANTALPIRLPGGQVRVNLTLSAMSGAVFLKRGTIQSTHWSSREPLQESVPTDADELLLLNAQPSAAYYALEIAQDEGGEAEATLKPGDLLERNASTAGRLRVPVELQPATGQFHLHVTGNTQALWVEDGGRIASGDDIAIHGSGVLWLQHQPGIIVAWLEAPGVQGAKSITDWFKSLKETTVKPPQTVNLRGKTQILNFRPERMTMLHVRTTVPVVTRFTIEGQPAQTEAYLHGANINLLVPGGSSRLILRAVGADSLSGAATVLATEPTGLTEKAGPEVLLAPGSARVFSFELKQQSTVGIGVRASSDIVHSVLYDARGVAQSRGVVQMPTLLPGRYYLVIETPPDTMPVQVRPIVFGLTQPDTRPPFAILRRYVEGRDNDALLYVPPPPGVAADEQTGADSPRPARKRRPAQAQPVEEQSEEGAGAASPEEDESEPPADQPPAGDESGAGTNEDQQ